MFAPSDNTIRRLKLRRVVAKKFADSREIGSFPGNNLRDFFRLAFVSPPMRDIQSKNRIAAVKTV